MEYRRLDPRMFFSPIKGDEDACDMDQDYQESEQNVDKEECMNNVSEKDLENAAKSEGAQGSSQSLIPAVNDSTKAQKSHENEGSQMEENAGSEVINAANQTSGLGLLSVGGGKKESCPLSTEQVEVQVEEKNVHAFRNVIPKGNTGLKKINAGKFQPCEDSVKRFENVTGSVHVDDDVYPHMDERNVPEGVAGSDHPDSGVLKEGTDSLSLQRGTLHCPPTAEGLGDQHQDSKAFTRTEEHKERRQVLNTDADAFLLSDETLTDTEESSTKREHGLVKVDLARELVYRMDVCSDLTDADVSSENSVDGGMRTDGGGGLVESDVDGQGCSQPKAGLWRRIARRTTKMSSVDGNVYGDELGISCVDGKGKNETIKRGLESESAVDASYREDLYGGSEKQLEDSGKSESVTEKDSDQQSSSKEKMVLPRLAHGLATDFSQSKNADGDDEEDRRKGHSMSSDIIFHDKSNALNTGTSSDSAREVPDTSAGDEEEVVDEDDERHDEEVGDEPLEQQRTLAFMNSSSDLATVIEVAPHRVDSQEDVAAVDDFLAQGRDNYYKLYFNKEPEDGGIDNMGFFSAEEGVPGDTGGGASAAEVEETVDEICGMQEPSTVRKQRNYFGFGLPIVQIDDSGSECGDTNEDVRDVHEMCGEAEEIDELYKEEMLEIDKNGAVDKIGDTNEDVHEACAEVEEIDELYKEEMLEIDKDGVVDKIGDTNDDVHEACVEPEEIDDLYREEMLEIDKSGAVDKIGDTNEDVHEARAEMEEIDELFKEDMLEIDKDGVVDKIGDTNEDGHEAGAGVEEIDELDREEIMEMSKNGEVDKIGDTNEDIRPHCTQPGSELEIDEFTSEMIQENGKQGSGRKSHLATDLHLGRTDHSRNVREIRIRIDGVEDATKAVDNSRPDAEPEDHSPGWSGSSNSIGASPLIKAFEEKIRSIYSRSNNRRVVPDTAESSGLGHQGHRNEEAHGQGESRAGSDQRDVDAVRDLEIIVDQCCGAASDCGNCERWETVEITASPDVNNISEPVDDNLECSLKQLEAEVEYCEGNTNVIVKDDNNTVSIQSGASGGIDHGNEINTREGVTGVAQPELDVTVDLEEKVDTGSIQPELVEVDVLLEQEGITGQPNAESTDCAIAGQGVKSIRPLSLGTEIVMDVVQTLHPRDRSEQASPGPVDSMTQTDDEGDSDKPGAYRGGSSSPRGDPVHSRNRRLRPANIISSYVSVNDENNGVICSSSFTSDGSQNVIISNVQAGPQVREVEVDIAVQNATLWPEDMERNRTEASLAALQAGQLVPSISGHDVTPNESVGHVIFRARHQVTYNDIFACALCCFDIIFWVGLALAIIVYEITY